MGDVQDLVNGEDGLARCGWAGTGGDYAAYHDTEWGRTLHGDDAMFERLSLEGFQAGLAWITVLRKRDAFRKAFQHFQIDAVAAMTAADVERLLTDPGIIRSRAKIESAIHNAKIVRDLPGGLDAFLWDFAPDQPPPPEVVHGDPDGDARVQGHGQGPEEDRREVHRPDLRLRPDAGHRHGGRSLEGVLPRARDERARRA